MPIIALDFFFIGEPKVERLVPAVAIRDSMSKALFAHLIPGKGMDYDWTAKQIAADIGRLGYPRVVIRSDQEPAISAMTNKVKEVRDAGNKETDLLPQGHLAPGGPGAVGPPQAEDDKEVGQ